MQIVTSSKAAQARPWVKMFDGKSLDGWQAMMNPHVWSVEDGAIVGSDPAATSLLFYNPLPVVLGGPQPPVPGLVDFEFKADVHLSAGGVSSLYFRSDFRSPSPGDIGVAPGYIAQANNTGEPPARTGSLYGFQDVTTQLVPDDTWWTQHVIAVGNRIRILVDGVEVVDFVDEAHTYRSGYLALLLLGLFGPTTVRFRNLMLRDLSST